MPYLYNVVRDGDSITLKINSKVFNNKPHAEKDNFFNTLSSCCHPYQDIDLYIDKLKSPINIDDETQQAQLSSLCRSLYGYASDKAAENFTKLTSYFISLGVEKAYHQRLMRVLLQSAHDESDAEHNLSLPFELGGAFSRAIISGAGSGSPGFIALWGLLDAREVSIGLRNTLEYVHISVETSIKNKIDSSVVGTSTANMLFDKRNNQLLATENFMETTFNLQQFTPEQQAALQGVFDTHGLVPDEAQALSFPGFWAATKYYVEEYVASGLHGFMP